jgi:hypothetical protein
MIPRIDDGELLGGSCSALLGGELASSTYRNEDQPNAVDDGVRHDVGHEVTTPQEPSCKKAA